MTREVPRRLRHASKILCIQNTLLASRNCRPTPIPAIVPHTTILPVGSSSSVQLRPS